MNLPACIIGVFNMLGIDSSKPAHLSEFGEKEDKCRLYIGSYHLVGKLVDGEYCSDAEWNEKNTAKIENYRFGFNKEVNFVQGQTLKPILQLDFEASIPWVLNERPED